MAVVARTLQGDVRVGNSSSSGRSTSPCLGAACVRGQKAGAAARWVY